MRLLILLTALGMLSGCLNQGIKPPEFSGEPDEGVLTYGLYTLITTHGEGEGSVILYRGTEEVWRKEEYRFYIGSDPITDKEDIPIIKDINGNGIPDCIIRAWTGGAHSQFNVYLLELGPDFKLIAEIAGNHTMPQFADMDQDGIPEVRLNDWSWAYWPWSFAESPAPEIILRWEALQQRYRTAPDLMKIMKPDMASLRSYGESIAREARETEGGQYVNADLFARALDLIYGGYADAGWQLLEWGIPASVRNQRDLAAEMKHKLEQSPYWRDINQPETPSAPAEPDTKE